jgi:hypothetical protein
MLSHLNIFVPFPYPFSHFSFAEVALHHPVHFTSSLLLLSINLSTP